jgi:hypothetical protein
VEGVGRKAERGKIRGRKWSELNQACILSLTWKDVMILNFHIHLRPPSFIFSSYILSS